MTFLTFKHGLDEVAKVEVSQQVKYVGQRSCHFNETVCTQAHTHAHSLDLVLYLDHYQSRK